MNSLPQESHNWPDLLNQLIAGDDLSKQDTIWAMDQVMSGSATQAQIAGFAVALRAKGETPAEISGMASAMLEHANRIHVDTRALDIVGTGGDRSGSVNISTMAALVVAATGAPVVKHGNRAASSKAGTADVLEALGIAIDLPPEAVQRSVQEVGIGFCFAPVFHPGFRHTGGPRRELGVPTSFNLLGPLTNPAQPSSALIGCAYENKMEILAEIFAQRGMSALVVRGDDGLDEMTTTTTSSVWVIENGTKHRETVDPSFLDIPKATPEDLRGGSAQENAVVVTELLNGKTGPVRDAVLLNAAGALAAYRGFSGSLTEDLAKEFTVAAEAIDSGAGANLLSRWVDFSRAAKA